VSRITPHLNEYLCLINKERLVLHKLLMHIGKYEYGIFHEEHIKTRKHMEKKMELFKEKPLLRQMHCISMKHNSRLRQIDAFFKAETEFDKIYNQIEGCAITHNFPHLTFYLPDSKVIGGGLVLEEWFDFLLKEHEGPQISLMTLLKTFLKSNANQRIKYTHRLFDVIEPNVRKIIEREIRGKINKQYDKIKIRVKGLQYYTAEKTTESRQQDSKIDKLVHVSTSPDTKWSEIKIHFNDIDNVDVSIKNEKPKLFSYSELGFRYETRDKKKMAWGTLLCLALEKENTLNRNTIATLVSLCKNISSETLKDRIKEINNTLKKVFKNIKENPIFYDSKTAPYGYKPRFKISYNSNIKKHLESLNLKSYENNSQD